MRAGSYVCLRRVAITVSKLTAEVAVDHLGSQTQTESLATGNLANRVAECEFVVA